MPMSYVSRLQKTDAHCIATDALTKSHPHRPTQEDINLFFKTFADVLVEFLSESNDVEVDRKNGLIRITIIDPQ